VKQESIFTLCKFAGRIVVNVSSKESFGRQATRCPRRGGRSEVVSWVIYGIRNSAAEQTSVASGKVSWSSWMIRWVFCAPIRVILHLLAHWRRGAERGITDGTLLLAAGLRCPCQTAERGGKSLDMPAVCCLAGCLRHWALGRGIWEYSYGRRGRWK